MLEGEGAEWAVVWADPDGSATSAAEGVAVDAMGNVYGAEVGPRMLRKYVRVR